MQRFSPRTKNSPWSELNKDIAHAGRRRETLHTTASKAAEDGTITEIPLLIFISLAVIIVLVSAVLTFVEEKKTFGIKENRS